MSKFLVTGGAGFIGSTIVSELIGLGHEVVVLDDLSTGKMSNLDEVLISPKFRFIEGSVTDLEVCLKASKGVDYVIHQAALVSVPKSIKEPLDNHDRNLNGFVNVLESMRQNNVKRLVYASSSAVYGDDEAKIKTEENIGTCISPYALTKYMDELYAAMYEDLYGLETIGLRYFNVYGPKQDPSSPYSGVISIFFDRFKKGQGITIYGDGSITRDFVFVRDVARANILAATTTTAPTKTVYNIGTGMETTILKLAELVKKVTKSSEVISFGPAREGDILYSCANVEKAKQAFGFKSEVGLEEGLEIINKVL